MAVHEHTVSAALLSFPSRLWWDWASLTACLVCYRSWRYSLSLGSTISFRVFRITCCIWGANCQTPGKPSWHHPSDSYLTSTYQTWLTAEKTGQPRSIWGLVQGPNTDITVPLLGFDLVTLQLQAQTSPSQPLTSDFPETVLELCS